MAQKSEGDEWMRHEPAVGGPEECEHGVQMTREICEKCSSTHVVTHAGSEDARTGGEAPASAHSPLPWHVMNERGPVTDRNYIRLFAKDMMVVATLIGGLNKGTGDGPTTHANAEFIVAAVNAHAELVAVCAEFFEAYDGAAYEPGQWPLMDRARAALAKVGRR